MSYTNQVTEVMAVLEQSLVPLLRANATYTTSYVSVANYHRVLFDIFVGALAASSTLDAQVHQAVNTAGGGTPKHVTGKAITQLTQAGGDTNCGHVFIELRTEELDVSGGFDCVMLEVVGGTGNTTFGVTIWGCEPRFAPVPTTTIQEIVA